MKLAVHISFFNRNKNKTDRWANADEKFIYLKKIIEEYNYYPMGVDIFIHTNKLFEVNHINYSPYKNGKVSIIQHNLFKYFIFKGKITILHGHVESFYHYKKTNMISFCTKKTTYLFQKHNYLLA